MSLDKLNVLKVICDQMRINHKYMIYSIQKSTHLPALIITRDFSPDVSVGVMDVNVTLNVQSYYRAQS